MRSLLALALILSLATAAMAFDLDAQRPAKPHTIYPQNLPATVLQGGDTVLDAVPITMPYEGAGTTVGYTDDYDEVCPYTGSTSPDVVYSLVPAGDSAVNIDLYGSTYDTKVYVYDQDLNLVACNDDFYPDYVSKLEDVPLMGGVEYYIVIDGYGGDAGEYMLAVDDYIECFLECPAGAELEGEPTLQDGYVDEYNSGCGAPSGVLLQPVTASVFCGVSGWYLSSDGSQFRDTDWFTMTIPAGGALEIEADAEYATYIFELGPQDCNDVAVIQNISVGPCLPGMLTIVGEPGDTVWVWVGPTTFEGPVYEYDYVLFTNQVIATEDHSWSGVKSLFR